MAQPFFDDQIVRGFETRSFPNSLAAARRDFTFYVVDPIGSIRRFTQMKRIHVSENLGKSADYHFVIFVDLFVRN